MGAFGGLTLTNKGIALQAKAQAGAELHYTRVAIGDGFLGGQSIATLTDLISEKKSLDITKLRVLGQGRAVIGTVLTNQDITTGFYFREIGIFADDPDEGEILYAYANAGNNAEHIPPGGGPDVVEKHIDSIVAVGQAPNVTAVIDQSLVFATLKDMNDHRTAGVLDHPDGSVTTAKLADGSVTDEKIGDRTISDTSAPSGNSGTLTAILGWLANMIKSITGKSNWRTPPATTLETAKAHMDATTGVHGATSAATANTLVQRDSAGRFKAAAPAAADDVARKAEVDAKLSLSGGTMTGKLNSAGSSGSIADSASEKGMIEVRSSSGTDAAFMTFRRVGVYAAYFGIDVDNKFKVGGWNAGSSAREIWHEGNLPVETGVWTPELRFGGQNTGITYASRWGRYTRIANVVYWSFEISLSSKGSASGIATIAGLPFNNGDAFNFYYHAVGRASNISVPSGQWLTSYIVTTTVYLATNTGSYILSSNFADDSLLRASGFYFI